MEIFGLKGAVGVLALVIVNVLSGAGAAVIWVNQGAYMEQVFREQKVDSQFHGKYFGIANGLTCCNYALGALITTFGIGMFSDTVYFIFLTVVGMLGLLYCWVFLRYPEEEGPNRGS